MRPLLAAIVALAAWPGGAAAEAVPAPGYALETLAVAGAMFSGLARDGDDLLVTDLASGRLLRRQGDASLLPFGPVLPHGPDVIGDPTGPYRVARAGDGRLIVAQGWTPVDADPGPLDHALLALDEAGEARVISGDFWNPFDFVADGDAIHVVDSAANAIKVLGAAGDVTTLYTFARLAGAAGEMQALSPTEFGAGEAYEVDAVPTGIAQDSDGRLIVTLFGGFPFLEGAGRVVSLAVAGGAAPRTEADGLNAPVAVAFDADGRMLVVEHGLYDQSAGFIEGSGRLLSIDRATAERRVLLDGLTRPTSVLVWGRGEIVVSDLGGHLHFLTERAE